MKKYYDEPYYAVTINKSGVSESIYDLNIGDLIMIVGEDSDGEHILVILEDEFETLAKGVSTTYWGEREDFEPIQLLTDA